MKNINKILAIATIVSIVWGVLSGIYNLYISNKAEKYKQEAILWQNNYESRSTEFDTIISKIGDTLIRVREISMKQREMILSKDKDLQRLLKLANDTKIKDLSKLVNIATRTENTITEKLMPKDTFFVETIKDTMTAVIDDGYLKANIIISPEMDITVDYENNDELDLLFYNDKVPENEAITRIGKLWQNTKLGWWLSRKKIVQSAIVKSKNPKTKIIKINSYDKRS